MYAHTLGFVEMLDVCLMNFVLLSSAMLSTIVVPFFF